MKPLDPAEAAIRRGIKTVAIGKKGSKPLPSELIEEILADLKSGKVAPVEKGAFFGALIVKGVTEEEMAFEKFLGAGVLNNFQQLMEAISPDAPGIIKDFGVRLLEGEELSKAEAEQLGDFLFSNDPGDGARGLAASILRVRYETADEYEGLLKSIHKTFEPSFSEPPSKGEPIIQMAEPFDGVDQSNMITPLVAHNLQKLGYRVVNLVGCNSGPKMENNLYDIIKVLKVTTLKSSQALKEKKPDLGWYIDQRDISKSLDRWVDLRRKIIKRPFLATLERFVNPVRADIMIGSAFHPPYGEKMITICERAGFPAAIIVRNGIEGTIAFPLKRSVKMLCSARQKDGSYRRGEFEFNPEQYVDHEIPIEEKIEKPSLTDNVQFIQQYLKEVKTSNDLFDQRVRFTSRGLSQALEWIKNNFKFLVFMIVLICPMNLWAQISETSFAVVELFTSEGCSSCPSADALLKQITAQAQAEGQKILTLGFHVDYWNYIGWRDPFSDAEFSERQRRYAEALQSNVYTPQMIINGVHEFVGSDQTLAERYIREALNQPARADIHLKLIENDSDHIKISYECSGVSADSVLNIAVVEQDLKSDILRGENQGRSLTHASVVRDFKTMQPEKKGEVTLSKPNGLRENYSSIVVYLQDSQTMAILGAKAVNFVQE